MHFEGFVCVYVRVSVCMYIFLYVWLYVCVCAYEQRSITGYMCRSEDNHSCWPPPSTLIEAVSLCHLHLCCRHQASWLEDLKASPISTSHFPKETLGLQMYVLSYQALCWFGVSNLGSSCLHDKWFTHWARPPALGKVLFVCLTMILKVITCWIQLKMQQVLKPASVLTLHGTHLVKDVDSKSRIVTLRTSETYDEMQELLLQLTV